MSPPRINRLFTTTALALLIALGLSAAVSYWLALFPPFQADATIATEALEETAGKIETLLSDVPLRRWDITIEKFEAQNEFLVDWYSIDEYTGPLDEHAALLNQQRIITYAMDDTPILELLFPKQRQVVEILPTDGLQLRDFLNVGTTVLAVLAIGLITAALVLLPIARRLGALQQLADEYGAANWRASNRDQANDSIGRLGASMQQMAGKIESLITDKTSLIQDQQDLMRAVAHEFRAPMARMRFALEMDEDDTDNPNHREASQALDELNDLVSEVLRYARLQSSAPDLELRALSARQLITEAIEKSLVPDQNKTLQRHLPHDDIQVMADSAQFQRALGNLIVNALKYSQTQVAISCETDNDTFAVHVDDDGPGIPPSERSRILTPFVRLDASRSRHLGGTGLGLAIANGVATKHHGSLSVSDSALGGARFTLRIRLSTGPTE
jgi:two-component system sensor histidine kinase RstB